jgi:hypothetical protein
MSSAISSVMRNSTRHDTHSLAEKAEAEHNVFARECEARWCLELEARRRQLAAEISRVLERIRSAS